MEKVNIIFGASTFVTMKDSKLLNNNIIEFDTVFSVADLSNLDNYELALPKDIYNENIYYSFNNEIKKLNEAINNNKEIRIWTSHFDINSYLLLLYLCNYLKDKDCNLYVVFSDEYDENIYSPACMRENELEELIKLEHKLSKEEIKEYSKEWQIIKNKKSDMRILENKKVKLVSFDYYNEEILNLLKELGEVKIVRLVGLFMNNHYLQDLVVSYFVDRLINNGKIKVIKYGERFFENVIAINK